MTEEMWNEKIFTTGYEQSEKDISTIKWNYFILYLGRNISTDDFNNLGQMGYELVAVDQKRAYFKRLLTDTKEYKQLAKNIAKEILDTPLDILRATK